MCVACMCYTHAKAAETVCTLRGVEGFSYFCSGKSVAPVSEAAKGKPRAVDRVSLFLFSSTQLPMLRFLVYTSETVRCNSSRISLFTLASFFSSLLYVRIHIYVKVKNTHTRTCIYVYIHYIYRALLLHITHHLHHVFTWHCTVLS